MALQKQPVALNFSGGVETKTDPYQVPLGKFLYLKNSNFTVGGLLKKRNGYGQITELPNDSTFITTFNEDLVAVGTELSTYSEASDRWFEKSQIQGLSLFVTSVVKNSDNQSQVDSVTAPNGIMCAAYMDGRQGKFVVANSLTGQNLIPPTSLVDSDSNNFGWPRVFLLGNYFIILYIIGTEDGSYALKYVAVNYFNFLDNAAVTFTASITPSAIGQCFDGAVYNNNLYVAWNGAGSSGIKMAFLTAHLVSSATFIVDADHEADTVGVVADQEQGTIWAMYSQEGADVRAVARDPNLNLILATTVIAGEFALNLTGTAQAGTLKAFYEISSTYSYDMTIPSNLIFTNTVTQAGVVGSESLVYAGVGLASKAFLYNEVPYFLMTYQSPYQSSYFLTNSNADPFAGTCGIVARIAYQNGGGYLAHGLPNVSLYSNVVQIPYLFKDLITAVNKNTNVPSGSQVNGIYTQTGVNLASFTFGTEKTVTAEVGTNLNITGGVPWAYDGFGLTEQNFFLYPDSIQADYTEQAAVTPTGDTVAASNQIENISSMTGVIIGMTITGTGIQDGSIITDIILPTTILISTTATATNTTTTLTIQAHVAAKPDGTTTTNAYFYQVTYEWSDNQGNIFRSAPSIPVSVTTTGTASGYITVRFPYLRETFKNLTNPVKICVYRWSVAQQVYYQSTSVIYPVTNFTELNDGHFDDTNSDAQILGNSIIYTNGGVLENTGAPPMDSIFLFDERLWGISSEDKNLLYFSKQVIEATPVEMSDLLTYYISPTVGAQGPTGVLECGAAMDDKLILFKTKAINYINGVGPDNTGANNGYSQPIFITSTVGCSNQNSIVFQPSGLMFEFQSEAGNQIWLLDRGLGTSFIGAPVSAFTKDATVKSAVNISGTNEIRFTMSNGLTLLYDYYYGQWGIFVNIPAVSSTIYNGLHTYINQYGEVFQETPNRYLDGSKPVLMGFQTSWINLAGLQGYQRAYFFYLLATYYSPHKLVVGIAFDYNPAIVQQKVITPDNYSPNYGAGYVYGNQPQYGGPGNLEQWKVYMTRQRCQSFQINLDEIYDPAYGIEPGQGFSMSGVNLVVGLKKGYRPMKFGNQVGGA